MSDLDQLEKKYEKGRRVNEILRLTKELEGSDDKAVFGIYPGMGKRTKREGPDSAERANIRDQAISDKSDKAVFGIYPGTGKRAKREGPDFAERANNQLVAGLKSQWYGLNDKDEAGIGKGIPGIYYSTLSIPTLLGLIDEKYVPDFAVEAGKEADKIKEAVRKGMGIDEPRGALQHFAYAGGEMLGQIPVPVGWLNKALGGVKKAGLAGKVAAAPVEYLSPIVDPKAINYGIGTALGGTLGTVLEPEHEALGGLIQKYTKGGKVGRFVSMVDKAINTLKQKKGTGEQILKQIEATPGVKQEELEVRGIKQKLQASPKITQKELLKAAQRNKAPIPERTVLGAGVPEDYKPKLYSRTQEVLDKYGIEPVVNPEDRRTMGFMIKETGDIADASLIKSLYHPMWAKDHVTRKWLDASRFKLKDMSLKDYKDLIDAVTEADKLFKRDLMKYETKFQRWSQPGSSNYREVLVHLPEATSADISAKRNRLVELLEGRPPSTAFDQMNPEARFEAMNLMDDITSSDSFTSGHYDAPNILTHFRVSDRVGPNGEKVLYVDEIQSDWHQKARDVRKDYINEVLSDEKDIIHRKAFEELSRLRGPEFDPTLKAALLLDVDLSSSILPESLKTTTVATGWRDFNIIKNRLTHERKAELDKSTPKDFGYRTQEDLDQMRKLSDEQRRISNVGLSPEEVANYFQPGKIVKGYGGYDKVISFNSGEGTPHYYATYRNALERALSIGDIDQEAAEQWARRRALEETKHKWSVTVIEVDPRTGNPPPLARPRTHQTSPADPLSYAKVLQRMTREIMQDLDKQYKRLSKKVPDAPFKNNWHELAVKEILDMAANEGYAKVAFSPGIEQVKRYSNELRKVVDEIRFAPGNHGEMTITAGKGGGSEFKGTAVDGIFIDGPAKGKSLSEVFGSSIAKRIEEQGDSAQLLPGLEARAMPDMSADELLIAHGNELNLDQKSWLEEFIKNWEQNVDDTPAGRSSASEMTEHYKIWLQNLRSLYPEWQRLGHSIPPTRGGVITGDDLTIGGEGMKDFYDKRLPDFIRKYTGKEFDAKTDYMDSWQNAPFLEAGQGIPGTKLRAFTVDVTPRMQERITTEGQKLFAVPPVIGLGVAQTEQAFDPDQEPLGGPEGFQGGGRVGLVKKAAEKLSGALRDAQEQKMMQGLYRGYAGDYDTAKASEASGLIYATPQRRAAENYANRRSQQMQADPHIEMLMVDPFAGRKYGHSVMTKASEEPIITQARELKPEDVKSVVRLKKRGGLAQAFPKSPICKRTRS